MRIFRPILVFALGMSSAPAVTKTAAEASAPEPRPLHGKGSNNHNRLLQNRLGTVSSPPPQKPETKYFHEPGGDAEGGHYDARFFRGKVPYDEHRPALRHLIRSYLTTFQDLGVETWLAHGSLLGWWWNGRIMPWDYDLDVQVSVAALRFLGARYNGTRHEYEHEVDIETETTDLGLLELNLSDTTGTTGSSSSGGAVLVGGKGEKNSKVTTGATSTAAATKINPKKKKKTYLLDVNPHHGDLTKGNGANVIDARWIDTSNGLFVDITGLRERERSEPGIWSCKNNHRYRTDELWPLRRTRFEGVEALIPYTFDKILTDEYGAKSLVATEWAG
jgi:hypothetical protein